MYSNLKHSTPFKTQKHNSKHKNTNQNTKTQVKTQKHKSKHCMCVVTDLLGLIEKKTKKNSEREAKVFIHLCFLFS